jgi:hypothetical protein
VIRRQSVFALAAATLFAIGSIGIRLAGAQPAQFAAPAEFSFAAVDVYIDSAEPLAAWQFELTDSAGSMTVVGVENGASAAFASAPHYDLDAVQDDRADRIIVADYSLADSAELPRGRTRVATIHVRLQGARAPDFELRLIAAGNAEGQPITAEADFIELQNGRAQ